LEKIFFNPVPGRFVEVVGFASVVRDNSSSETSSSMGRENEVKTSSSAEVSVFLTGYENEVELRASSSADTSDSSAEVEYVSVASKV